MMTGSLNIVAGCFSAQRVCGAEEDTARSDVAGHSMTRDCDT
jgi:hypothetical protein